MAKEIKFLPVNKRSGFSLITGLMILSAQSSVIYAAENTSSATQDNEAKVEMDALLIEGRKVNLIGDALSASEGVVGAHEIQSVPLSRTGEILEFVPGMVVTQHSGTGKANQYFLRGFNLDHGTDFATFIDGMPVNMRTHGHGQGYTDLNFVIPETLESMAYKKGAYYADVGDFSGAGSAEMRSFNRLNAGALSLTVGEDDYVRMLAMDSTKFQNSSLSYALEHNRNNGPWSDIEEDLEKTNLWIKHHSDLNSGDLSITLMGYDNRWNSADQIPARAVNSGVIDEFGSLDKTVGGESSRYSLSLGWSQAALAVSAYLIRSDLNLWSNFTYYLDNETEGDQFEQVDERSILGANISYADDMEWGQRIVSNTFGIDFRYDLIDEVGLYHTQERARIGAIRSDEVDELSVGLFWQNEIEWTDHWRSTLGFRYDYYDFDVKSLITTNVNGIDLSQNSGTSSDSLASVKGSLIYKWNNDWESYMSAGQGFHSNDARGTTIKVDPADGSAVESVDPLVQSFGYEAGTRGFISNRLNVSLAIWTLELDSELLFVGDAGNTEASGESKRTGVEFTSYYQITKHLMLDFEYAITDAEFVDGAPGEKEIPGAVETVVQAGLRTDFNENLSASARLRHFGERPLIEDGSVESDPTTVINLMLSYRMENITLKGTIINLTDSDDHDVDYFYESRLTTDPSGEGTEDVHYHIIQPRTIRASVAYTF